MRLFDPPEQTEQELETERVENEMHDRYGTCNCGAPRAMYYRSHASGWLLLEMICSIGCGA